MRPQACHTSAHTDSRRSAAPRRASLRAVLLATSALASVAVPITVAHAGPIDATVYAASTRPDVEFVANIEDVAPDGASMPLTSGALLGSLRAVDPGLTWNATDGRPLLPYHPYTRESAQAVPVGAVTRYDIEVFPIDTGRLRRTA